MSMSAGTDVPEGASATEAVLWFCMRANILLPAAALLALSTGGHAADTSWRDIESRIQYGYYTEDVPALRSLAGLIAADESHDKLHGYYAALLNWRLAQLAAQGVARDAPASAMAERCLSAVDEALSAQADFADALALRAACQAAPVSATAFTLFSGHQRLRRDLERARQLAPHDPRVLLVDAMNDYQLPQSAGGNKDRALPKLRLAVAAFEAERAGLERLPGWGAAEAYLFLARDLLDHGDPVAARDALERALLLAPEFAQARRLMAKIIAG
jgi:hypothetical protein